jgi:glutathione synthase
MSVNTSLLFVADPLEAFKTYKDTTFAMMREAARRGHGLIHCTPADLVWQRSGRVTAVAAREFVLTGRDDDAWFDVRAQRDVELAGTRAVLMRKDPPFDSEYFYATHLLQQAEREGARVFNKPAALRDHPEKLAILEFAQWTAPTIVTRSMAAIRAFHDEHQDIIVKPLDGMGGTGIFRVRADGMNLGAVVETLGHHGSVTLMVQRFVPEIVAGDKRILIIDGAAVPYCLARIPQGTEVRGNLAAGGKGVAQPLSEADQRIAAAIGPTLRERGLLLAGIDVIGDRLTEINVTSPTCFQEIAQQTGFDVARVFIDALERALAA